MKKSFCFILILALAMMAFARFSDELIKPTENQDRLCIALTNSCNWFRYEAECNFQTASCWNYFYSVDHGNSVLFGGEQLICHPIQTIPVGTALPAITGLQSCPTGLNQQVDAKTGKDFLLNDQIVYDKDLTQHLIFSWAMKHSGNCNSSDSICEVGVKLAVWDSTCSQNIIVQVPSEYLVPWNIDNQTYTDGPATHYSSTILTQQDFINHGATNYCRHFSFKLDLGKLQEYLSTQQQCIQIVDHSCLHYIAPTLTYFNRGTLYTDYVQVTDKLYLELIHGHYNDYIIHNMNTFLPLLSMTKDELCHCIPPTQNRGIKYIYSFLSRYLQQNRQTIE